MSYLRGHRRHVNLRKNAALNEQCELKIRKTLSVEKLIKASVKEKCLAVQLLKLRLNRSVNVKHETYKNMIHNKDKQAEVKIASCREKALSSLNDILNTTSEHKKNMLHDIVLLNIKETRYNKHFLICKRIIVDIIDMSIMNSELIELYEGDIPKNIVNEKLDLFLCEVPQFPQGFTNYEFFKLINDKDFQDYLNMEGHWQFPRYSDAETSKLAQVLSWLFDTVHIDKPMKFCLPYFPQFSLKVCVLGGPYSGKSTCCQMLSSVFRLQIIDVDKVVNESIAAFKDSESIDFEFANELKHFENNYHEDLHEEKQKFNVTKKLTMRAELGRQALEDIELGCSIKDKIIIELLVEFIRRIPDDFSGWVLDGFPCTIEQLHLLETALSGHDPPCNKKFFKSRILDSMDKKQIYKSAIDVAIVIDVPDGIVCSRSYVKYGFNNEIISGQTNENMLVLQGLELYKLEIKKLVGWFRKYGRVNCLEGSMDVKDIARDAIKILNEVMIQLSSAYLVVEKDIKDNQFDVNLKLGDPICREQSSNGIKNLYKQKDKVFLTLKISQESAGLILDLWCHIEDSYVRGCQLALKQIRNDSQEIVSYLAQLRNDFKEVFKQPNSLCACLIQFQKDFNSFPAILRRNYRIKAELCQRVDELQGKLWNICDENKKKIESHINVCCNGEYVQSCSLSINNHLMKLVKLELYKLENISNMLKDVYSYSHGITYSPSYSHEHQEQFRISRVMHLDSSGIKKTRGMFEENRRKLKSNICDDKQVQNIFEELSHSIKILDEMETFGKKPPVDDSSVKKSSVNKKSVSQFNAKERNDMMDDKYMWMNYLHACMKEEVELIRERIKAIEDVAHKFDDGLHTTTNNLLNVFNKWALKKYLTEIQSIDQVCDLARNSSEYGQPISDLLTIGPGDFFMDGSFEIPALLQGNIQTTWIDKSQENLASYSDFTICQLFSLFHRFVGVSPTGLISKKMFHNLLQQIANDGTFPESWMNNCSNKIELISCMSSYDDEFISWRKFILLVVNPMWPKMEDLLMVLSEFRKLDQLSTGCLTKEQFLKAKIWLDKNGVTIKEFLFHLFANHQNIPSLLDYETFLLNFCLDENPIIGLNMALTMASIYQNDNQCLISSCKSVNKEIISVHMLYKVLFPLPLMKSQGTRFFNKECRTDLLLRIFKDLEIKAVNGNLPIKVIAEHPLFKMITRNSCMFWFNIPLLLSFNQM